MKHHIIVAAFTSRDPFCRIARAWVRGHNFGRQTDGTLSVNRSMIEPDKDRATIMKKSLTVYKRCSIIVEYENSSVKETVSIGGWIFAFAYGVVHSFVSNSVVWIVSPIHFVLAKASQDLAIPGINIQTEETADSWVYYNRRIRWN